MHKTYSNTQRGVMAECPRKYHYKYELDLDEPVGAAAVFSRECVHPLLQTIHREPGHSTPWWGGFIERRWVEYVEAVGDTAVLQHPELSRQVLEKIVKQYAPMVEADREEGWQLVGVEVTRGHPTVRLGETQYTTRVDVVEWMPDGATVPVEIKFTTRERQVVWDFDNQIVGHAACFGAPMVLLVEVVSERPTKARGARVTVSRTPVSVSADVVAEWEAETMRELAWLEAMWDGGVWTKRTTSCYNWGRPCHFMRLCEAGALRHGLVADYPRKEPYHAPNDATEKGGGLCESEHS